MSSGNNTPTIAALPASHGKNNNCKDGNNDYSSPPFPNKRASQEYLTAISPPRDLICPITQELFIDPVVAIGDGCTYERSDIKRWFEAQQASNEAGSGTQTTMVIRSPVSNAFMHGDNPQGLVENRIAAGLAQSFRERLGIELCGRCEFVCTRNGIIGDGGFRIKSLVEAGADLSLKGCSSGNTALMMLIKWRKIELIKLFLLHGVPVTITNNDGQTPLDLAQQILSDTTPTSKMQWHDVISQITKLHQSQTQKIKAQNSARTQANQQHRERQRVLSATNDNAARRRHQPTIDQDMLHWGLGTLEANGRGYFPSLAALQFQGSVPEPSASFADVERRERRRLDWILRGIGCFVLFYFLIA